VAEFGLIRGVFAPVATCTAAVAFMSRFSYGRATDRQAARDV
jgi:hypothetical protein